MGRREQAEASRAALVEAARQCFTEYGYEATTVAGILARAGMARGALYHYFPDGKREIFGVVFERINDAFHQRRNAVASLASPVDRIHAGIDVFLDLCTQDDFARIALIDAPKLVAGQAERGSSYELLRAQIEEAADAGQLRPIEPEVLAVSLYGAVRSAGEFVVGASDREQALVEAKACLNALLSGVCR